MRTRRRCCFTARDECSAGILPAVPRASRPRIVASPKCCRRTVLPRRPDEASGADVGLAGVNVEAEDCVYFYRLVAAKYGTEFPVG
jgi:hypothetical protein